MNILQTTSGTFDISSPIKVAEYTATAPTLLLVQLAASGLDGNGVNACLTRTVGAIRYQTGVTTAAGSAPYLAGITMPVSTGDVLGVWMEGQAADTAAAVRVEIWDAYAGSLVDALDNVGVDPQGVRDAMKLAPTAGAPAAGSVDAHLDALALEATAQAILEDTGTTLPTAIAAIEPGGGSYAGDGIGYYSDTIDDGTSPLDGVRVQLYTSPNRVGPAYEAYTNALGVFEMWPDPGTYYRWLDLAGYNFSQDVAVTVTEP